MRLMFWVLVLALGAQMMRYDVQPIASDGAFGFYRLDRLNGQVTICLTKQERSPDARVVGASLALPVTC